MAYGPIHFDLRSIILIRCTLSSLGMVAKQIERGSPFLSAFPHWCREMCDESQVNMEIIINYVVMDRNALFWLGNLLVSGGGLPDVTKGGRGMNPIKNSA